PRHAGAVRPDRHQAGRIGQGRGAGLAGRPLPAAGACGRRRRGDRRPEALRAAPLCPFSRGTRRMNAMPPDITPFLPGLRERYDSAEAALERLDEIYQRNTEYLRSSFSAFAAGWEPA